MIPAQCAADLDPAIGLPNRQCGQRRNLRKINGVRLCNLHAAILKRGGTVKIAP